MTDAVHIFVGPTLTLSDRDLLPDATYHPPVAQGDVYRLTASRPFAVGIIDGYFERVPSVWHKEILWALSQGVHVFGSASMGALRAAELAPFGMVGIGEIFSDFVSERLEDDDEVTLVHADEKHGYLHASEPLVNIRATLNAAVQAEVIVKETRDRLVEHVKTLYYPERNYDAMLSPASGSMLAAAEIDRLKRWLSNQDNRVDLKRMDARRMLEEIRLFREKKPGPKQVTWTFQHTDAWAEVKRSISTRISLESCDASSTFKAVVDELKLCPSEYMEVKREAVIRQLAVRLAALRNESPSNRQIERSAEVFRRKMGLFETEQVEKWLCEQMLTDGEFAQLMKDQAAIERLHEILSGALDASICEVLKLKSRYGELARRAERKQAMEMSGQFRLQTSMDRAVSEDALLKWFFHSQLDTEIPSRLDSFHKEIDISSRELFVSLLRREYLYRSFFDNDTVDSVRANKSDDGSNSGSTSGI